MMATFTLNELIGSVLFIAGFLFCCWLWWRKFGAKPEAKDLKEGQGNRFKDVYLQGLNPLIYAEATGETKVFANVVQPPGDGWVRKVWGWTRCVKQGYNFEVHELRVEKGG